MHVSKFSSDLSDLSFTIGDLCSVKSFIAFTTVTKSYGQTYDFGCALILQIVTKPTKLHYKKTIIETTLGSLHRPSYDYKAFLSYFTRFSHGKLRQNKFLRL